jgi:mannose-1-phosphate guanylyltransferase
VLYSTILAGGSGTRLWPLSRACFPKFLHPLTGTERSLLQATADRLAPLSSPDHVYVVTGTAHAAAVARQLSAVPDANILVEPAPRDSCAAAGLAAAVIAERDPDAIMGVFAADHLIGDQRGFEAAVRQATAAAAEGYLATIGIQATRPETGFGYLKAAGTVADGVRLVAEFKEKPPPDLAAAYVASGDYLWNAGMFVFAAATFLDELARYRPGLHAGVRKLAAAWESPGREALLARIWPELEKISVDYAVLEPAATGGRVVTVPADIAWTDVGDFDALGESLPGDASGNLVLGDKHRVVLRDVKDTVIAASPDLVVAAVGVENLVIAVTPDAVLVCPRARAQEVKQIVDELATRGDRRYI